MPSDSPEGQVSTRLVAAARAGLAAAGDPERAAGQQAYMKSAMPCRGVRMPHLRRIFSDLMRESGMAPTRRADWEATVHELFDAATFREERYVALELCGHSSARAWQDPDTLGLYRHLVVTGAWWDVVDPVASHLVGRILLSYRPAVTPVIQAWAVADDLWLRRTAIICQLTAKDSTDLDLLTEVVDENDAASEFGREFFIRKAIGWALRQYAWTDPHWVRGFVADRGARLSGLSRREATKHL